MTQLFNGKMELLLSEGRLNYEITVHVCFGSLKLGKVCNGN